MSAADFSTTIRVSGSKEGIAKVLEVVKYYEEERIKQYQAGEPYVDYLEWVKVSKGKEFSDKNASRLKEIVDIEAYVKELKKCEITITAEGPYGRGFATLDEIDLYNDIADKLDDTVEFEGYSYGFNIAGRQSLSVTYKGGKLEVDLEFKNADDYEDEEYDVEGTIEKIINLLPLVEFKNIFSIEGKLSEEDYKDLIEEYMVDRSIYEEFLSDRDYFIEGVNEYMDSEDYSIGSKEFKEAAQKLNKLGMKKVLLDK